MIHTSLKDIIAKFKYHPKFKIKYNHGGGVFVLVQNINNDGGKKPSLKACRRLKIPFIWGRFMLYVVCCISICILFAYSYSSSVLLSFLLVRSCRSAYFHLYLSNNSIAALCVNTVVLLISTLCCYCCCCCCCCCRGGGESGVNNVSDYT